MYENIVDKLLGKTAKNYSPEDITRKVTTPEKNVVKMKSYSPEDVVRKVTETESAGKAKAAIKKTTKGKVTKVPKSFKGFMSQAQKFVGKHKVPLAAAAAGGLGGALLHNVTRRND